MLAHFRVRWQGTSSQTKQQIAAWGFLSGKCVMLWMSMDILLVVILSIKKKKKSQLTYSSVLKSIVQDLHKCDRTKYHVQIKNLKSRQIYFSFPLGVTVQLSQLAFAEHAR